MKSTTHSGPRIRDAMGRSGPYSPVIEKNIPWDSRKAQPSMSAPICAAAALANAMLAIAYFHGVDEAL
jgi:hypothetical protein